MDSLYSLKLVLSATALAVVLVIIRVTARYFRTRSVRRKLASRAARARRVRDQVRDGTVIPAVSASIAARVRDMGALELADAIRRGEISALDAVAVAAETSRQLDRATNCCAEVNYKTALDTARMVDAKIAAGENVPLLAGVPFSVKDSVDMAGFSSTCGLAVRALAPRSKDNPLVEILINAGAIPVVRSNVPMALMLPETTNAIWLEAKNPWDRRRTPGGSSGGEGTLVAAGATAFGVGTDIGGSIRIPCHFCGAVGFKPTPIRVTRVGCTPPRKNDSSGQEAIRAAVGPISRCVDDSEAIMALWLDESSSMWAADPYTPRVPWKSTVYRDGLSEKRKLRIGYYTNDGWFTPSPACQRAVTDTVAALERSGVECVPFKPVQVWEAVRCYYALLSADGKMRSFIEGCEGEALHPRYDRLYRLSRIPFWLRPILAFAMRTIGWKRIAWILAVAGGKSAYEFWEWTAERKRIQKLWTTAMQDAKIDGLITPALSFPALPHGASSNLTPGCSYTLLFNVLHWPAGIVPVTTVRDEEETYLDSSTPRSESWHKATVKACVGSAGLPVGVQIATLSFQDELCLHVMKKVEAAVEFSERPELDYI